MTTNTRNLILEHIKENHQLRAYDLMYMLGMSRTTVHKQLKKLLNEGKLQKIGTPPRVYYLLRETIGFTNKHFICNKNKN